MATGTSPHLHPATIAGHTVERPLNAQRTYLAKSETGRRVVLKLLDSDCLLQGKLHPSVHTRLSRVCELAHAGVANLHGVHLDGHQPWMVWDYVEGTLISELIDARKDPRLLTDLARELLVAVDALHAVGIIHGAIVAGNVIVDARGRVKLTHVSPLLHDDPSVDIRATEELLTGLAKTCGTNLRLTDDAQTPGDLKQMRRTLARAGDAGYVPPVAPLKPSERMLRLRPLVAAVLVAGCAVAGYLLLRERTQTVTPVDAIPARVAR